MRISTAQASALVLGAASLVRAGDGAKETGPSFDCAAATGQVEQLVCKDAALSALDRKMAQVFAAAVKTWPANIAAEQRAAQRGWVKGRNDCWKEADVRACTEQSYGARIVELQIQSGQFMAPAPVGYACTGGEDKDFLVTFYAETDPKSAVITYGGDQVIALSRPTGSGARYGAANVDFWEHHGEAAVEWFGTKLACRVLDATTALAKPPKSAFAASTSSAFLASQVGKTPSDARVFANPVLKERLASLLKADAALVPARFQTENPIQIRGDLVALFGNKAHSGGSDDALLVANVETDELWVWLRVGGKLRRFGPAADPAPLPDDAAVVLTGMKGQ